MRTEIDVVHNIIEFLGAINKSVPDTEQSRPIQWINTKEFGETFNGTETVEVNISTGFTNDALFLSQSLK
jgi:hypothetical protein